MAPQYCPYIIEGILGDNFYGAVAMADRLFTDNKIPADGPCHGIGSSLPDKLPAQIHQASALCIDRKSAMYSLAEIFSHGFIS